MWFGENVNLFGYTVKDSGNWDHAIQNSRNIRVNGITVIGGHDGFDIRTCDDVFLEECSFYTGDDAVAGFDNINVTIRDSVLNSSCSALRFGGTNILIENCTASAPNRYGYRGDLSVERKKARSGAEDGCRRNCLNVFLYYCDYRAKIRKTPGNILIKNCRFTNIDSIFSQPFGGGWACNRALDNIKFEDCIFDGVCKPININCPEDEPLTFVMKGCRISARSDASDVPIAEAKNFREIKLENVDVEGYDNARIAYCTDGNIIMSGTTHLKLENGVEPCRGAE